MSDNEYSVNLRHRPNASYDPVGGGLLVGELGARGDLVCLDEVELKPFDTIDIGAPIGRARAVPVVIKSMVFA